MTAVALTVVGLFSGVGGFELALQRAGVHVVAAVEIDPAARGVLTDQFPGTVLLGDVSEVVGEQLRAAGFVPGRGILVGGFPCQDLSVAGRRAGLDGARSGLYWHVDRLMAELRPRWVILENVPGLLSSHGGRDMGAVLRSLGNRGYGWAYRVLDAQHFGVPQRRRRVFIVGCLGDRAAPAQILLEPESRSRHPAAGREARAGVAADALVGALGTSGPGGGWRIGPDESAAGQLVVARALTAKSGHRTDGTVENFVTFVKARRAGEHDDSPESWRADHVAPDAAQRS